MRYRIPNWCVALLAGIVFPLGLAPVNFWPAIPLSTGLLYAALIRSQRTQYGRCGYAYGAGFFFTGVSWVYVSIHVYGNTPVWLAAALTGLFCGGLALLFAAQAIAFGRLASTHMTWRMTQFASLWVLFEWLRSWLLTGFPWGYAGYGSLDSPLAGWIPVVGVYGTSWLLVAIGCCFAEVLDAPRRSVRWAAAMVFAGVIAISGLSLQRVEWTSPKGTPIAVAVVQPNVPLREKWDPRYRSQILSDFRERSAQLAQAHTLVVWPESALPAYQDRVTDMLEPMNSQLALLDSTLVTGIPTRDATGRYNSIIALGAGSGTYHKQKLVPFGEFVPLERWLRGVIDFFDLPMSQFIAGPEIQGPLVAGDLAVAPFICYEIVYPDFVQRHAADADVLITISNDTWFGQSIGPWQHFQMARFRAAELGRDLIRGTNDGVSALITADGAISVTASQFSESVITGSIQPRSGHTPFGATGSLPVWVFALITLVLGRDRS